jgi:SM-20-related protein
MEGASSARGSVSLRLTQPGAYPVKSLSAMDINRIASELEQTGYIVLDKPLLDQSLAKLFVRCHDEGPARFQSAQVGRGADRQHINAIRGDVISWLDDTDLTDQSYLGWMEELRTGLNEALYLGLFSYECHYAIYGAGTGYAKHSDVLHGKRNRILSTVLYLNENWQVNDGGELVIFAPTGDHIITTVNPTFGTMILFLSESFPHEVLLAHKTRRSITGWFRVNGS